MFIHSQHLAPIVSLDTEAKKLENYFSIYKQSRISRVKVVTELIT